MISPDEVLDIKAKAYCCKPYNFKNICQIYPLTMSEIIDIGYKEYTKRLGLLTITEIDIQKIIKEKTKKEIPIEQISPLNYLLQNADYNDNFFLELKRNFSTFIKEEVLLLPQINAILVNPKESVEKRRLITEENFSDFQNILRIQNRQEEREAPPENESPMRKRMRLLREKVEEIKRKKQSEEGKTTLIDLLEMGEIFGIDLNTHSIYAFYGLIQKNQAREKWLRDIQMLCAGADADKLKINYWGESSKNE